MFQISPEKGVRKQHSASMFSDQGTDWDAASRSATSLLMSLRPRSSHPKLARRGAMRPGNERSAISTEAVRSTFLPLPFQNSLCVRACNVLKERAAHTHTAYKRVRFFTGFKTSSPNTNTTCLMHSSDVQHLDASHPHPECNLCRSWNSISIFKAHFIHLAMRYGAKRRQVLVSC